MPDLRTIRGVELIKVGTWNACTTSGEPWTVTADDLEAAVTAHDAELLRRPVIKIGHDDPRFDGSPALGHLDNLRLADGGRTLVADFVDVPAAIAKLLPNAYPSRSVEAIIDYEALDGTIWPLVLTGVALLGATAPGIDNLAAIQDLYGVAAKRVRLPTNSDSSGHTQAVAVAAARRRRNHRMLIQPKG